MTQTKNNSKSILDSAILWKAVIDSFVKLDPRVQARNPVMFVVELGSVITTLLFFAALSHPGEAAPAFIF